MAPGSAAAGTGLKADGLEEDGLATHPRRVLLHVGTHRTGTTAFQRWLVRWRDDLLRDHGILVHQGCFLPSHLELPALVIREDLATPDRWLLDGRRFQSHPDPMRRAIRATVESDAPTVLFSAEGLSYMRTPDEVDRLGELMAPREVTAIVTLRDRDSFLASFRAALRKMGFGGPVRDRQAVAYTEPDSWLTDYRALLDSLRLVAGPRVIVIDYERETSTSGSTTPALAEAIGLPRSSLYPGWERWDNVILSGPWRETAAHAAAGAIVQR